MLARFYRKEQSTDFMEMAEFTWPSTLKNREEGWRVVSSEKMPLIRPPFLKL